MYGVLCLIIYFRNINFIVMNFYLFNIFFNKCLLGIYLLWDIICGNFYKGVMNKVLFLVI